MAVHYTANHRAWYHRHLGVSIKIRLVHPPAFTEQLSAATSISKVHQAPPPWWHLEAKELMSTRPQVPNEGPKHSLGPASQSSDACCNPAIALKRATSPIRSPRIGYGTDSHSDAPFTSLSNHCCLVPSFIDTQPVVPSPGRILCCSSLRSPFRRRACSHPQPPSSHSQHIFPSYIHSVQHRKRRSGAVIAVHMRC